jgi:hypothetical protein
MEGLKPSPRTTGLIVGVLIGWILGQMGLVGLVLAGVCLGVITHYRGYRIMIEKENSK